MGKSNLHNDMTCFRLLIEQPEQALEAIYAYYGRRLRSYVYVYFRQDAEFIKEVMVETLIVLWQKREEVARYDKPYFWMQRVAHRQAAYLLRKQGKHHHVPLDDTHLEIAGEDHADRRLRAQEIERLIAEALDTLPVREQEIFKASRYDELTNQELMQRFGLSEQTVKNTLSRAKKKLASMLKNVLSWIV